MKIYKIKDVTEGICAIEDDGTLEDLNRVLKAAFPEDENFASMLNEYYLRSRSGWKWTSYNNTELPKQSVKLFIKELEEMKEDVEWIPEVGEMVEVWDGDEKAEVRPYLSTTPRSKFPIETVAGDYMKIFRETTEAVGTIRWENMRQIKPIKEVEKEEKVTNGLKINIKKWRSFIEGATLKIVMPGGFESKIEVSDSDGKIPTSLIDNLRAVADKMEEINRDIENKES